MMYSAKTYEVLFDREGELPSAFQQNEVGRYRTQTVKAGPMLYCNVYPIWATKRQASIAKEKKTREAQRKLNERNAARRLDYKLNANFGPNDMLMTLTHNPNVDQQPRSDAEALEAMRWMVAALKKRREEKRIAGPFKYVYGYEWQDTPQGARYHYHMIFSGAGLDRDEVEDIWRQRADAGTCNTRRYQKQDSGLTGWARYINLDKTGKERGAQHKGGKRRWNCSKNLINPEKTAVPSDHKISRRKAERIGRGIVEDAKAVFEKAYPGYELVEVPVVKTSDFVQGVYIYAKMRRIEERKGVQKDE